MTPKTSVLPPPLLEDELELLEPDELLLDDELELLEEELEEPPPTTPYGGTG